MSIVIVTDVFCDGPECGNWTHGTTGKRVAKKRALAEAKREGWNITARRHLCPWCAKLQEKEKQ